MEDKFLNTDFRIVVEYTKIQSRVRKEKRHLVGRRGLINLLGMELYLKVVNRAYKRNSEKITLKVRNRLVITFYQK